METLSPSEWVGQARSASVRKKRELLVRYWVEANGFPNPAEGIKLVVSHNSLYRSFNAAVQFMETRGMAPNTLAQYRGCYRDFIQACIGHLDENRFNSIVKEYQAYSIKEKLCPRPEEFTECLVKAGLREKALISFLGVTGMRIGEALSRKWSDIDFTKNPPRVHIEAEATKKRYARYAFLSRETAQLLHAYRDYGNARSDLIFPVGYWAAAHAIMDVFHAAGLKRLSKSQSYSPHSLRQFSLSVMRKAGFSDSWAQLIVGHRNLETKSYKGDWDEIAQSWLEKVEPHFNFLNLQTAVPEPQRVENKMLYMFEKDRPLKTS